MDRLTALSLKNRALIALVTLAIGFFGLVSMSSLKQELFPELSLPVVSVTAEYRGAAPDVVDREVAQPIEAALQGLEGLKGTQSTSRSGSASVMVELDYGTDLVYAEQRIQQAISRIDDRLPDGIQTTVMSGSISDFPIMQLAATGGDQEALASKLRTQTIPELLKLEGVRDAQLSGAPEQRIAIRPNTAALQERGLTTQAIRDTLDNAGVLVPIGEVTDGDSALTVQAGDLLTSADAIAKLPIAAGASAAQGTAGQGTGTTTQTTTNGTTTIGDVAEVKLETAPVETISRVNGEDALTIAITKVPAENTVDVSRTVRDAMPELGAELGDGVTLQSVFDQAPYVERSIHTLLVEGLLGLLFAVLVIFVFLRSVRSTLVTAISIPASLLVTFIALQGAKYSLNMLTLGALTIAIGRVVDDSIVVIENIKRHLGKDGEADPARRRERITRAVREVAGAVTSSTIATVAVYLPIAFVGDIAGEMFRPFALTSVIALLASLIVSLTIVPVLAYWFLGAGRRARRREAAQDAPAPSAAPVEVAPEPVLVGAPGEAPAASDVLRRKRPKELRAERDRAYFAPLALRDGDDTGGDAAELRADEPIQAPAGFASDDAPEEVLTNTSPRRTRSARFDQALDPEQLALEFAANGEQPDVASLEVSLTPHQRQLLDADVASLTRRERRERDRLVKRLAEEEAERAAAHEVIDADEAHAPMSARDHGVGLNGEPMLGDRVVAPEPDGGTAPTASTSAPAMHDVTTEREGFHAHDERPDGLLQRLYLPILNWTLAKPLITLGVATLILVLTGALAPFMKTNFLGSSGEDTISIQQTFADNATLDVADQQAAKVEEAIMAEAGVKTVQLTYGGNSLMSMFTGSQGRASYSVTLEPGAKADDIQARLQEKLGAMQDVGKVVVGARGGSGFSTDLEVELDAPTTDALKDTSAAVIAALEGREGIREVRSSLNETRPYIQIDINRQTAADLGLSEFAVGAMVAEQVGEQPIGEVIIEGESVQVKLVPSKPVETLDELKKLKIQTMQGERSLVNIARINEVDAPTAVTSVRGTPTATVTVVPEGDDLGASNRIVSEALAAVDLPDGSHAELGGVSRDQQESFTQLGFALLAAILIVYIIMVATFRSLRQPLLLLISVPFAATGAILLLIVSQVPLGLPSLIGVLMLIGIVVTNAIVLIDLVNQFRDEGFSVRDALIEGGARRVRPIIMTALATILALTPMALGITGEGGFISQPLAIVVIGGLLSSTLLTLVVLPALFYFVEGRKERRAARR